VGAMRCDDVQDVLVEFLDGGLEAGPAAEVRAHLAGCARCAALREDLRATLALVNTDLVPEPPAGTWERFADDVLAKIRLAEETEAAGPPRRGTRSGLPLPTAWDRLSAWAQRAAFAPVAVATAAAVLLAIGVARNQPGSAVSERDLALVQDLEVLRAVDRPDDLEMIEHLPALLALVRTS